jgi:acyl-CoA synthetase (AMP-forming)/AMP-acid ligase II
MPATMIDELAAAAARHPDRVFSFYEGRRTTYGELWQRARQFASALRALGVPVGHRIAYLGKNTDRLIEVIYGASIARGAAAILNWRLAPPEWAATVKDSGAGVLVVDQEFVAQGLELADGLKGQVKLVLAIDASDAARDTRWSAYDTFIAGHAPAELPGCAPDDVFLQLYTSGTTGRPKGVPQTHAMHLSQRSQWESRAGGFPEDDRFLVFMPLFHAAGITFPLFAIGYGTQVEIHREADPARILEALASGRISATAMVPTLMAMLLPRVRPGMFPALRRIFYGGSGIDPDLLRRAIEVFACDLIQIYAATETTAALTMLTGQEHRAALDRPHLLASAGKPGTGAQLRLVTMDGRDAPPGEPGEIWVRSDSVLQGYWRNEAATAQALQDRWYRTGDMGRIDDEGYLYVVDRVKDMIITGGENVYSSEVENALAGMPGLREFAVVGVPDPHWGEIVTACVVPQLGAAVSLEAVHAYLRPRLACYKLPRHLEVMDALPRNPMGKLQKHLLRARMRELRESPSAGR